jgi:hypothetical protein
VFLTLCDENDHQKNFSDPLILGPSYQALRFERPLDEENPKNRENSFHLNTGRDWEISFDSMSALDSEDVSALADLFDLETSDFDLDDEQRQLETVN